MCLTEVTQIKSERLPKDQYYTGWKVITIDKQKETFCSSFNKCRSLNKWIKCRKKISDTLNSCYSDTRQEEAQYPYGFHIFTTRKGARSWKMYNKEKIVRVRYRRVVARGMQYNYGCVIAKEMYVEYPRRKGKSNVLN